MEYIINLFWDNEANVWIAICDTLCLALESDSLEVLIERVKLAFPELLAENNVPIQEPKTLDFIIRCKL